MLISVGLIAAGCADAGGDRAVTRTDSAGVEIVYSAAPRGRADEWALGDEPLLEIVSDESDTQNVLYQVVGAALDGDGRVAVANRGDGSLRLYGSDGRLVWRAGRPGEGPDELTDVRGVVLHAPGYWVFQSLPRPIKVFDRAGAFVRSVPTAEIAGPRFEGLLSDGSQVAVGRSEGEPSGTVWTERSPIVLFDGTASDTIALAPARRMVELGGALVAEAQTLGPFLQVATGANVVYAGFPATYDVRVLDRDGRLLRRLRRAWTPTPVTDAQAASYRDALVGLGEGDPRLAPLYRELADAMVFPEHHPAFDRLLVDATGALWSRRPQTEPPWPEGIDYNPVPAHPATWDVFAADGAWAATVVLPARYRLLFVGEEAVAGVAKDELDVERVQVWPLRRGT